MTSPDAATMGPVQAWAASGAMALTGEACGPPRLAPGAPGLAAVRSLQRVDAASRGWPGDEPVALPGVEVLGERAALEGLQRRAPWSCGGSFRTLQTADSWWGLSLPRPEDLMMVPALLERPDASTWQDVAAWSAAVTTAEALDRGRLLGLACSAPNEVVAQRRGVELGCQGGARATRDRVPLVVDLSALWAGPLCAHLLKSVGARVVKVESRQRPDGGRRRRAFFDLLHAGSEMVAVDLDDPRDLAALRRLLSRADIVIESSRPRALRDLGIVAQDYVRDGAIWVSITARGRTSDTIGFGDDVAAGAGLTIACPAGPCPCGDALADPLTGLAAAAAAAEAFLDPRGALLDVSMHHVCAAAAGEVPHHDISMRDGAWWVASDEGDFEVVAPRARPAAGVAGVLGADTRSVLERR